jgi:7-cyano-7-deazaguanine synthase
MSRPLHLPRRSSAAIPPEPAAGPRNCVLLLSGGLDSATCLALACRWGWTVHALSFDYGQRHRVELRAARALARRYRAASHRVIAIPSFGALGGSALTDRSIRVPKKALGKARIPART